MQSEKGGRKPAFFLFFRAKRGYDFRVTFVTVVNKLRANATILLEQRGMAEKESTRNLSPTLSVSPT
jgi:hypothetical protein